MQEEFNEQNKSSNDNQDESEYAYKNVIKKDKTNRRTWSVISLVLGILSSLVVHFSWVSLILSIAAVVLGIISRNNIGYFDGISIAGISVGIFGIVFAIAGLIFGDILFVIF